MNQMGKSKLHAKTESLCRNLQFFCCQRAIFCFVVILFFGCVKTVVNPVVTATAHGARASSNVEHAESSTEELHVNGVEEITVPEDSENTDTSGDITSENSDGNGETERSTTPDTSANSDDGASTTQALPATQRVEYRWIVRGIRTRSETRSESQDCQTKSSRLNCHRGGGVFGRDPDGGCPETFVFRFNRPSPAWTISSPQITCVRQTDQSCAFRDHGTSGVENGGAVFVFSFNHWSHPSTFRVCVSRTQEVQLQDTVELANGGTVPGNETFSFSVPCGSSPILVVIDESREVASISAGSSVSGVVSIIDSSRSGNTCSYTYRMER